ncbi:hypothetical protein BJ742DRAFT_854512 [Cladochytrium replicatum]|nr:hypothetical protein BJ742DRAFT_854512 [Cladochytrium replicatum]
MGAEASRPSGEETAGEERRARDEEIEQYPLNIDPDPLLRHQSAITTIERLGFTADQRDQHDSSVDRQSHFLNTLDQPIMALAADDGTHVFPKILTNDFRDDSAGTTLVTPSPNRQEVHSYGLLHSDDVHTRNPLPSPARRTAKNNLGIFARFSEDLCLYLLCHMDLTSSRRLAQTCHFWARVGNDDTLFRQLAHLHFGVDTSMHQVRLAYEGVEEQCWRDLYQRLDCMRTGFKGFALDRATNAFAPYPMELIINTSRTSVTVVQRGKGESQPLDVLDAEFITYQSGQRRRWSLRGQKGQHNVNIRRTDFDGCCRWSSLRNSLTRTQGFIFDDATQPGARFRVDSWLGTNIPRPIAFDEVELLRGEDIAVPNKYYGFSVGPIVLGMYDPGHPHFMGAFVVSMEESFPAAWRPQPLPVSGMVLRGLFTNVSSSQHRKAYHCELCFTKVSRRTGAVKGIFSLDITPVKTSADPIRTPRSSLADENARLKYRRSMAGFETVNSSSESKPTQFRRASSNFALSDDNSSAISRDYNRRSGEHSSSNSNVVRLQFTAKLAPRESSGEAAKVPASYGNLWDDDDDDEMDCVEQESVSSSAVLGVVTAATTDPKESILMTGARLSLVPSRQLKYRTAGAPSALSVPKRNSQLYNQSGGATRDPRFAVMTSQRHSWAPGGMLGYRSAKSPSKSLNILSDGQRVSANHRWSSRPQPFGVSPSNFQISPRPRIVSNPTLPFSSPSGRLKSILLQPSRRHYSASGSSSYPHRWAIVPQLGTSVSSLSSECSDGTSWTGIMTDPDDGYSSCNSSDEDSDVDRMASEHYEVIHQSYGEADGDAQRMSSSLNERTKPSSYSDKGKVPLNAYGISLDEHLEIERQELRKLEKDRQFRDQLRFIDENLCVHVDPAVMERYRASLNGWGSGEQVGTQGRRRTAMNGDRKAIWEDIVTTMERIESSFRGAVETIVQPADTAPSNEAEFDVMRQGHIITGFFRGNKVGVFYVQ